MGLGISWVWMGLEGRDSQYGKLDGTDTLALVGDSCRTTASACWARRIIGLEEHTPDNIDEAIDHAVRHDDRIPPVHALHADPRHAAARRAPAQGPAARLRRVTRSPTPTGSSASTTATRTFPAGRRPSCCCAAFQRDFARQRSERRADRQDDAPGWKRYRNHPDLRVRAALPTRPRICDDRYAGALWADARVVSRRCAAGRVPSLTCWRNCMRSAGNVPGARRRSSGDGSMGTWCGKSDD